MRVILPGTAIEINMSTVDSVEKVLDTMFLTGGLVLSQISDITSLPPHTIQNWVKRGFIAPPVHKRYDKNQFARILLINSLKDAMQIETIVKLICRSNENTACDSHTYFTEMQLYCYFADAVGSYQSNELKRDELMIPEHIEGVLSASEYVQAHPNARHTLSRVLDIMATAYIACLITKSANEKLSALFQE